MDKIELIRVFETVARHNSFTKAANELDLALQTVSKYIKTLENQLGVQLFDRTTRKVNLNATGVVYLQRCTDLLEHFDEVEASVREAHSEPKGKIRLSAPTAFGEMHLIKSLSRFLVDYPEIEIDLDLSNRRVSIVEEGFDVAIRIGTLTDSSMVARKLGNVRVVVCASPDYLKKHGTPSHPRELADHNCLIDNNLRMGRHWPFKENGTEFKVDVSGNFQGNSPRSIRATVAQGVGVGYCPIYVLSEDIAKGNVVLLFEDMESVSYGIYAMYPHRKNLSKRVRTLVDFLAENISIS